MDNIETKGSMQQDTGTAQLQEQIDSLRQLVVSILLLVIVVSGAFNIYLYRQYKAVRTDVTALGQVVGDYKTNSLPALTAFAGRLIEYSRTHPDFAPIVAKYGLNNVVAAPGAAPAGVPAPAPAAVNKAKK